MRPSTTDPHSRNHSGRVSANHQAAQLPVMAPTPIRPASSLLPRKPSLGSSLNAFKVPLLSESSTAPDVPMEVNAHIPTPGTGSSFSGVIDQNTPNMNSDTKPNQSGPRRIPLEQSTNRYDSYEKNQMSTSIPGHEITEDGRIKLSSLRQTNKRTRSEVDDDEQSFSYGNQPKRFKSYEDHGGQDKITDESHFSPRHERPSSGLSHSNGSRRSLGSERRGSPPAHHHSHPRRPSSPSNSAAAEMSYPPYKNQQTNRLEASALEKLLGRDSDQYAKDHMADYDRMVDRWSDCSMAEWIAGADEIASKYHKMLDFVKSYMDNKLKLYANLHANVDKHTTVLGERDQLLIATREKLLQQGGNVLG